jgi:hypothetical protein
MKLRRLPIALTAAAAVALSASAGAAHAAAPWLAPVTIPGAGAQPAPLIVTGDGHAIAFPAAAGPVTQITPLVNATGAPIAARVETVRLADAHADAYARGHYVLAGSTLDADGTISDRSHVQLGYGTSGGDVGPLKGITGSTGERVFGLDANDDGVVAVLVGNTKERRLLIRRPNGRGLVEAFSTTVGSQGRGATVAVGAKGDVLVVWENAHRIYARHVGPSGGVGALHQIGDGVQSHLQAAVEAGGRLMAAWVSQRVSEGDASGPATLYYTTAAPGHGFGKAYKMEDVGVAGTGRYVSDPAVRLVTGGASLLAWTGTSPATGRYVVKAMQIDGGHRGSVQTVSDPAVDSVLGDLRVDPSGLIWRTGIAGADPDGTPQTIQAARRTTPAPPFGTPETIAAPGDTATTFPYPPQLALVPTTGSALAEYGQFAGTSSTFQVAARPAL